jgi:hypothetical protein
MKKSYRTNLLQVTVMLINANQEVCVLRDQILDIWCLNHSRVFTRCSHAKKTLFFSRKNFSRRHAGSLLQYVGNEHTLKLVTRPALRKSTPKSLAVETPRLH